MLNYDSLQKTPRVFLSVTSLLVVEFQVLRVAFAQAFEEVAHLTNEGKPRQRKRGGGQIGGKLPRLEDKLLFISSYIKNYPSANISRIAIWDESTESECADSQFVTKVEKSFRNTRMSTGKECRRFCREVEKPS